MQVREARGERVDKKAQESKTPLKGTNCQNKQTVNQSENTEARNLADRLKQKGKQHVPQSETSWGNAFKHSLIRM